ncbi:unnamed protein product [Arctia plantaginis]|uniref:N-acetyltransferase domain-containing protein n=1 Tax=Arctia plantaginis TaxID=874455 RepID=A0A8S0Z1L6_ARCPL|nr:unnamed protein product [Arctia plantaginis]
MAKVMQANLQRCRLAIDLLLARNRDHGADMVLVSEQYHAVSDQIGSVTLRGQRQFGIPGRLSGSVLGPKLWIILYDAPTEVLLEGFADDVAVLVLARSYGEAQRLMSLVATKVDAWLSEHFMSWATAKMSWCSQPRGPQCGHKSGNDSGKSLSANAKCQETKEQSQTNSYECFHAQWSGGLAGGIDLCHDAFSRTFSRVKLTYNPLYSSVIKFYNDIEKPVNIFDILKVKRYFKVYILALKQRYRHRGIAKEMLKAAETLSRSANVPALAGIFTTNRLQVVAEELGYKKLNEIYYIRYLVDGEIVFWDTGLGNYGAAIMACRIPDINEPEEPKVEHSSRFTLQPIDDEVDGEVVEGIDEEVEEQ